MMLKRLVMAVAAAVGLVGLGAEIGNGRLTVSFDERTGSFAARDRLSGRTWRSDASFARETFAVSDVRREGSAIAFKIATTNRPTRCYACRLALDGGEIELTLDAPKDQPMAGERLGYPYPFASAAGDRFYFPNGCGLSLPCDLKDPSGIGDPAINRALTGFQRGYMTSMKMGCWFQYAEKAGADGSLEQGAGVLAIVRTPWNILLNFAEGANGLRTVGVDWVSSLGKFGEARCVRFAFLDRATPGAFARRYRAEMERRGFRVTFAEKARRNPKMAANLDLLQGAPDVWYWTERADKAAVARELKSLGFDNFLFSTVTRHDLGVWVTPEEVRELAKIPRVLVSEYDIYRDTMEPAMLGMIDAVRPHWPLGVWDANDYVTGADGKPSRGWKVALKSDPSKPCVGCLLLCEKQAPKYIRERIASRLAEAPYNTRFLDVTGTHVGECWNPAHPLTRRESMVARQEMFRTVRDEFSLVTGTEDGLECYVPYVDYLEGVFNASHWRVDGGRHMWKIYEKTPAIVKRGLDPAMRFPFWEMVFRDCVVGYWYWTCYNNRFPEDWWKMDLLNVLAGTPPMYFFTPEVFARQKRQLAASCPVATATARAAKGATLDELRWLTADRLVQESEFSNGLVVTVNFSDRPHVTKDGRTVPPRSYLFKSRETGNRSFETVNGRRRQHGED